MKYHLDRWDRRSFLRTSSIVGAAQLVGFHPHASSAEPPPETSRLRLPRVVDVACFAPMYIAEELLRAEGFSGIEYVAVPPGKQIREAVEARTIDLGVDNVHSAILGLDAGSPVVLVSGVHVGCYELFAHPPIRSIRELKGKKIGVPDDGRRGFVASMVAYVGLNPRKDITWVTTTPRDSIRAFSERQLDAFMGFPPESGRASYARHRPRSHRYPPRQALVPVLLLCRDV